jgi:restriction system protein
LRTSKTKPRTNTSAGKAPKRPNRSSIYDETIIATGRARLPAPQTGSRIGRRYAVYADDPHNSLPTMQSIYVPALKIITKSADVRTKIIAKTLASHFKLTPAQLAASMSPHRKIFQTRVDWALSRLKGAGLIDNARKGYWNITDAGRELMSRGPKAVNPHAIIRSNRWVPPSEFELQAAALLKKLEESSPQKLEAIVMQFMINLGYGHCNPGGATLTNMSKDGGIDILIKQDRLGLDRICIQVKRWIRNSVGRDEIQSFVGALFGEGVTKGVFITTAKFTQAAREYARCQTVFQILLIDGMTLAKMMLDPNLKFDIDSLQG